MWKKTHHDNFNPLGDWIWFVVLFFSQHTGKMTQLPDWTAFAILPGELHTHTDTHEHTQSSFRHPTEIFFSPRCYTSSLPPGPGRRMQGRRSWRQSNWPIRTYSQNNTWSLTEAHLQNNKTRKYLNYFATHFPMSWSIIIKNTAQVGRHTWHGAYPND